MATLKEQIDEVLSGRRCLLCFQEIDQDEDTAQKMCDLCVERMIDCDKDREFDEKAALGYV